MADSAASFFSSLFCPCLCLQFKWLTNNRVIPALANYTCTLSPPATFLRESHIKCINDMSRPSVYLRTMLRPGSWMACRPPKMYIMTMNYKINRSASLPTLDLSPGWTMSHCHRQAERGQRDQKQAERTEVFKWQKKVLPSLMPEICPENRKYKTLLSFPLSLSHAHTLQSAP